MNGVQQLTALGAEGAADIAVRAIPFDPAFRAACAQNQCGYYGACWMCPPDVGEIDDLIRRAQGYERALVFQSVYPLEDSFDIEGMEEGARRHNKLTRSARAFALAQFGPQALVLGAGSCHACAQCARRENLPCRTPELATPSLEAHGIAVSELAKACGLKYVNPGCVTYFGVILYDPSSGDTQSASCP